MALCIQSIGLQTAKVMIHVTMIIMVVLQTVLQEILLTGYTTAKYRSKDRRIRVMTDP